MALCGHYVDLRQSMTDVQNRRADSIAVSVLCAGCVRQPLYVSIRGNRCAIILSSATGALVAAFRWLEPFIVVVRVENHWLPVVNVLHGGVWFSGEDRECRLDLDSSSGSSTAPNPVRRTSSRKGKLLRGSVHPTPNKTLTGCCRAASGRTFCQNSVAKF